MRIFVGFSSIFASASLEVLSGDERHQLGPAGPADAHCAERQAFEAWQALGAGAAWGQRPMAPRQTPRRPYLELA